MYRLLLVAGSAIVITIALLLATLLGENYLKQAEHRRQQEILRKTAARINELPHSTASPPQPAVIDPNVARLLALGEERPPRGKKRDYTWRQIEAVLESLRSERKQRPQALGDLEHWYNYLADPAFTESSDIPEHLGKMAAWRDELPESTTPLVVLAGIHIKHAWEARGGGFADTVTPEGWQQFRDRIETAQELLEEALESGVKDGHASALLIIVAKAGSWPKAQAQDALDEGRQTDSAYTLMYQAMAEYLLPRWHGEPGDIESFAAQVVQTVPGDDGLEAYGRIAFAIHQYEPQLLFYGKYDRKLLGQAAVVLAERYPRVVNQVAFAALCTVAAQDHQAARRVQPFIEPNKEVTRVPGWSRVKDQYSRWCKAREIPNGESDWIWATNTSYGNIVFDSDSRFIWCGQGGRPSPIVLLDLQEKDIHLKLEGPGGTISGLALDDDKEWLAAIILTTEFNSWVLWNTKDSTEPMVHKTEKPLRAIALSPTASQIALCTPQTVELLDLPNATDGRHLPLGTHPYFVKYSGDGKLLAINESVWDVGRGEKIPDIHGGYIGFDNQQRPLTSEPTGTLTGETHYPLYCYTVGKRMPEILIPNLGNSVKVAELSPDGMLLALATESPTGGACGISVWNLSTKKLDHRFGGHWEPIGDLAFSNDGKKLASIARRGGPIKIWSLSK